MIKNYLCYKDVLHPCITSSYYKDEQKAKETEQSTERDRACVVIQFTTERSSRLSGERIVFAINGSEGIGKKE